MSFAGFLNQFSRKFVNGHNILITAAFFGQTKIYTPAAFQPDMNMQHFWHDHFICSEFNILQTFCPPFGSRKHWKCQDMPGIGKPFPLKHGKLRMRSSAELRTDPGFFLALCWCWGHKYGLVPSRCPLGQHRLTPCPAPGPAVPGAGRRGHCPWTQLLANPQDHSLESHFSLSQESTQTSLMMITQLHCWLISHTFTAPP